MQDADTQFDELRKWIELPDIEVGKLYSEESHRVLAYCVNRLGSPDEKDKPINSDSFVALVKLMRQRLGEGSRLLGETIIKADNSKKVGNISLAFAFFNEFRDKCPSECYREVADNYIKELSNGI